MSKSELVIEKHPDGTLFIELDSLIAWFEGMDQRPANEVGKFAAYAVRGMREKALSRPNRVMTKEQYYREKMQ